MEKEVLLYVTILVPFIRTLAFEMYFNCSNEWKKYLHSSS